MAYESVKIREIVDRAVAPSWSIPESQCGFVWKSTQVRDLAVIGPEINIRISAKEPLSYVQRYKITPEKLAQQFIDPEFTSVSFNAFDGWLRSRAQVLANEGNAFLAELRGDIGVSN